MKKLILIILFLFLIGSAFAEPITVLIGSTPYSYDSATGLYSPLFYPLTNPSDIPQGWSIVSAYNKIPLAVNESGDTVGIIFYTGDEIGNPISRLYMGGSGQGTNSYNTTTQLDTTYSYNYDTTIQLNTTYSYNYDTTIQLNTTYSYNYDTTIQLNTTYNYNYDTTIQLNTTYNYNYDTTIQLSTTYNYNYDTTYSYSTNYNYSYDTISSLDTTFSYNYNTTYSYNTISSLNTTYNYNYDTTIQLNTTYNYSTTQSYNTTYSYNTTQSYNTTNSYSYSTTQSYNTTYSYSTVGESEYIVRLTVDQANATAATWADCTGLQFELVASKDYIIEFWIIYNTSATTVGIDLAVLGTASPTSISGQSIVNTALATIAGRTFCAYTTSGGTYTAALATASNIAKMWIILRNGSNAGTFILKFRPETTGTVTVVTGSILRYRQTN